MGRDPTRYGPRAGLLHRGREPRHAGRPGGTPSDREGATMSPARPKRYHAFLSFCVMRGAELSPSRPAAFCKLLSLVSCQWSLETAGRGSEAGPRAAGTLDESLLLYPIEDRHRLDSSREGMLEGLSNTATSRPLRAVMSRRFLGPASRWGLPVKWCHRSLGRTDGRHYGEASNCGDPPRRKPDIAFRKPGSSLRPGGRSVWCPRNQAQKTRMEATVSFSLWFDGELFGNR